MPLIPCPDCGRQVSPSAVACPQCGRPMRAATPASTGPRCYSCSSAATTRCQSCGKLSCAQHLKNIYVSHGRGGANELRCEDCYSWAIFQQRVGMIVGIVILIVFLTFAFNMFNMHGGRFR